VPTWFAVLAVSIVALAIASASWAMARREKTRLGFLLATTQALLESRDLDAASVEVLRRASVRFGADCAELTLLPETGIGAAFRTTVLAGEPVDVMRSSDLDDDDNALTPPIYGVIHIAEATADPWVVRLCSRLGVSRGLAVTLRYGSRTVGYLALGMPTSDSRESRADDEQLQEFANHVALTIERSRLHDGLVRLATLQSELADRAFHDPLTQLANRVLFMDRTERALLERNPGRHVVSVISVQLEDFRRINAEHGHAAGDAVLVEVAGRLHECLRRTDTAARLGGDEFALLLPEMRHPREAELIAQRVVEALAAPVSTEAGHVAVKASVGLACANAEPVSAPVLLRSAMSAAQEAREAGSNTYRIHGGTSAGSADPKLAEELELALSRGELVLHYQPIVELRTGKILGAEALVRWQHPVRGLIPPLHFLPAAVEYGLIERIEDYVMRTACEQLSRWQVAYPATPELAMSINVAAGELSRGTLVDRVTKCLARVGVDPASLILEVTENAVLEDLHSSITTFGALQRAGVQVAIDNVGTGYTSLAYLRRLPIDILKIARPLIAELGDPNSSGEPARTVVTHGEALRLALVAEGVELPLQVKRLNELGCGMAQGFLFAHPCDPETMEALLSKGGLDPAVFGRVAPANVAPANGALVKVAPAKLAPVNGALAKVAPADAAPVNGALAKTAPAKVAAAEAAPVNGAPVKVAPADAAPAEVTAANVAPVNGALVKVAPAAAVPEKVAPAEAAPVNGALAKTAPAEVVVSKDAPVNGALAKVAPVNGALATIAPAGAVPVNGAPVKVVPAEVAPAKLAPVNGALAKTAPKVAPPKVAQAKAAPVNGVLAKIGPAKAAPVNGAPVNGAPVKVVPAKAVPVNGALARTAPKVAPAEVPPLQLAPAAVAPAKVGRAEAAPVNGALATIAPADAAPLNGAPVKTVPAKLAPATVAPAKVGQAKVPPVNGALAKVALADAAPVKVVPAEVAPVNGALVKIAPADAAPVNGALATTAPKVAPAEVTPVTLVPATAAPVKLAPAMVAPVKAAPAKLAAAKTAPAKVASAKAAPTKRSPVKRVAAKVAPAKRSPVKRAPAKVASAKPTPVKRAAAKVAPVKRSQLKRVAAKVAPTKPSPVKRVAAKGAPAKRSPVKRAPARVAPAKRSPVKRTAAKVAPAKRAPVKRAPATSQPARPRRVPSSGARARNSA
jgi:diguanylate cyclase (GGDEF)-like protein